MQKSLSLEKPEIIFIFKMFPFQTLAYISINFNSKHIDLQKEISPEPRTNITLYFILLNVG